MKNPPPQIDSPLRGSPSSSFCGSPSSSSLFVLLPVVTFVLLPIRDSRFVVVAVTQIWICCPLLHSCSRDWSLGPDSCCGVHWSGVPEFFFFVLGTRFFFVPLRSSCFIHCSCLSRGTKEKILGNLANFAYDPYNYNFLRQLNVLELFLDYMTEPSEKLVEFGVGEICNSCAESLNGEIVALEKAEKELVEIEKERDFAIKDKEHYDGVMKNKE
ncbi:hypothetical protein RIF29_39613 [Crotalaria pallida]|uniref:Uncharacterized protein n=1 Tax=Crotalaria pallida TaxID=3830 RepID=A0AAN9HQW0_CROPI